MMAGGGGHARHRRAGAHWRAALGRGQRGDHHLPPTSTGNGPPEALSVNTRHNEFAPYVAPDESYMIFVSNRPGGSGMHDLWITFRKQDGTWSEAMNMRPAINTSSEDGAPTVTFDGLYLFYTTARSGDASYKPYWVSSQVIQKLRSQAGL